MLGVVGQYVVCSIETHQPDMVSFVILKVLVACCHIAGNFITVEFSQPVQPYRNFSCKDLVNTKCIMTQSCVYMYLLMFSFMQSGHRK